MSGWIIALLIVAVVLTWLLFWVAIVSLLARIGGWRTLADAYPCDRATFEGASIRMQSAMLRRGVAYKHMLTFTASHEGLRIAVNPLFKFGHRPILLPWSELSVTEQRRLLTTVTRLEARRLPALPIFIGSALARRLAEAAGDAWPAPPSP